MSNDIRRAAVRATTLVIPILIAACAGTRTPPPLVTPAGEAQYLVDPRVGYKATVQPSVDSKFEKAWRFFLAGDYAEARTRFADLRARNPEYTPAALALAAIDIAEKNLDSAATIVRTAEQQVPDYTAAKVYEAEIAVARHETQTAYDLYNALAQEPNAPPIVAERVKSLRDQLFNELFAAAQAAQGPQATDLLRQALAVNPGAIEPRIQLANRLIAQRSFEEALQVLNPIATSADANRPDVQAALAEIEVGRGDFQTAMARYQRLADTTKDARYTQRLNEVKELWNEANMPSQYQKAIESQAIDRTDFAVLLYWKLTSVRFSNNLASPPIAIDLEDAPGREEMIRAMAIGLYDVDPVTRRVQPNRPITAASLERLGARVLQIEGASCVRSAAPQADPALRAQATLTACGIPDPAVGIPPDAPVAGRTAAAMLDQIEHLLSR